MTIRRLIIAILYLTQSCLGCDQLKFSAIFSHGVVLQRDKIAAVYGSVELNAHSSNLPSIVLMRNGEIKQKVQIQYQSHHTWKALLQPTEAGTDYQLQIECSNQDIQQKITRVSFGDVYFCGGQSNMSLFLKNTFGFTKTLAKLQSERLYSKLHLFRFGGMSTQYPADTPQYVDTKPRLGWYNATAASMADVRTKLSFAHDFASTCIEFGVALVEVLGENAPPIGLLQSTVGGTLIEAWMSADVLHRCNSGDIPKRPVAFPTKLYNGMIAPFVNMTLTGFLWYQGEQNAYGIPGNSKQNTGYGCKLTQLVKSWRAIWSIVPGTTKHNAVFGIVTLAAGNSEGNESKMGAFRWSQTGNYGYLPSPELQNAFVVQAYDLGDPWPYQTCKTEKCCPPPSKSDHMMSSLKGHCMVAKESWTISSWYRNSVPFFLGPIHPRVKSIVGKRLANGVDHLVYNNKTTPLNGPTLASCDVSTTELVVHFNNSMFFEDQLIFEEDSRLNEPGVIGMGNLALCFGNESICKCTEWIPQKQTDGSTTWVCAQSVSSQLPVVKLDSQSTTIQENTNLRQPFEKHTILTSTNFKRGMVATESTFVYDQGALQNLHWRPSPHSELKQYWKTIRQPPIIKNNKMVIDLTQFHGIDTSKLHSIRYAWPLDNGEDTCCPTKQVEDGFAPCPPESCPIRFKHSRLPANPFFAEIRNSKCVCPAPQEC